MITFTLTGRRAKENGYVYKALALGATAVGLWRAYSWGLASFGQEGVETVIELLRRGSW
jgi:isopentenyl diphosphate isomerase/L-lactate dehydrogenase-like FMN-dependent dehydrogenase